MDLEALEKALREELRASGRFSELHDVELEAGPSRRGLAGSGLRVRITFDPTVRVADAGRFTATVESRFEEVFPGIGIRGLDYEDPESATGVVDGETLEIRPARGPTIVLTVDGLPDRLRPSS